MCFSYEKKGKKKLVNWDEQYYILTPFLSSENKNNVSSSNRVSKGVKKAAAGTKEMEAEKQENGLPLNRNTVYPLLSGWSGSFSLGLWWHLPESW